MNKQQAQESIKDLATTVSSLNPSALISLYEIDISKLLLNSERKINTNITYSEPLRFHNNLKLVKGTINFGGKSYYPAPIRTENFEMSAKGTPPNPKMSVTVMNEGLSAEAARMIVYLKMALRDLDDLVGAKVTRIRTFAKYLDCSNFYTDCTNAIDGTGTKLITNVVVPPEGWDADPYSKFPNDVFFIDRKAGENKNFVELELASPFDSQDLKLPARIVTEKTCIWSYRGEGCCYEYNQIKAQDIASNNSTDSIFHNDRGECKSVPTSVGAPPIANDKDEKILDLLKEEHGSSATIQVCKTNNTPDACPIWSKTQSYNVGHVARIVVEGINYFFVSSKNNNIAHPPPNSLYWHEDKCSKSLVGCKLRWAKPLPFGAFPTSRRAIK